MYRYVYIYIYIHTHTQLYVNIHTSVMSAAATWPASAFAALRQASLSGTDQTPFENIQSIV